MKAKTKTAAKKKPAAAHSGKIPVPLPAETYGGARGTGQRARLASGYTSLRVSRHTAQLLKEMQKQAIDAANAEEKRSGYYYGRRYYNLGFDELLYFDALQRLGRKPAEQD